jgi:transcriptional regulator with XRE-family HTH domain
MPGVAFSEARRAWERTCREVGEELRGARRAQGLSQATVAAALHISQPEVSRRERGQLDGPAGQALAAHAAAVGLQLVMRCYPAGDALRDEAQLRWTRAFVARMGSAWRVTLEVPVPIPGDRRAVDVLLVRGDVRVAVEVVTRLTDVQAQLRAARLKARDLGASRLIVVVAGSARNRATLVGVRATLAGSLSLDGRFVLAELAAGRDPGTDALILLPYPPGGSFRHHDR